MSSGLSLAHEPVTKVAHGKLAMWIFLASEIMFFTGFFGAFIVLRNSNLELFSHSAAELTKGLALLNTFILIGSSLTMALSILNLEKGNIEYSTKFSHHIFPWTNVFFSFYFLMTGFHAIHVIAGMIPMTFMFIKAFTKKGYNHPVKVETLGLYWHFVDLVWIFLFPVLYLIFPAH